LRFDDLALGNTLPRAFKQVLELVNDYTIYSHFIGKPIPMKEMISSPLRVDPNPSFNIYYPRKQKWDGQIIFKDFNGETGNVFKFVKLWAAFHECVLLKDAGSLTDYLLKKLGSGESMISHTPPKVSETERYDIIRGEFKEIHIDYFASLSVTVEILEQYRISACEYLLDSKGFIRKDFRNTCTFAYVIFDRFKLYQPEEENFAKFFNQCPPDYMQGYEQCYGQTDTLLITKALKDILTFQAHTAHWQDGIAPHGEGYILTDNWIAWILRYPKVLIIYDPDYTGVRGANRLRKQLLTSRFYRGNRIAVKFISYRRILKRGKYTAPIKDLSDYRLLSGPEKTRELCENLLKI
jgi:hypothetical protein